MEMQQRLDALPEEDAPRTEASEVFMSYAPHDMRALLAEIEREHWLLNKANYVIANVQQGLRDAAPPGSIDINSLLFTSLMVADGLLEDWLKAFREESGNVG